jgi:hypothetical protein
MGMWKYSRNELLGSWQITKYKERRAGFTLNESAVLFALRTNLQNSAVAQ